MSAFLNPTTLLFYISLVGILGMFGFKASELHSGNKSLISRITVRTDKNFRAAYHFLKKMLSYVNKKSAIALLQWIAYHILSWAREVYIWAHRKAHSHPPSRRVIDMVRGKGEVKKNAGVSFFLKSISTEDEGVEVKK